MIDVKFVFIITLFFLVTFSIFVVNSIPVYGQTEDYCQGDNNEHCYAIANYDPEGVTGRGLSHREPEGNCHQPSLAVPNVTSLWAKAFRFIAKSQP